MLQTYDGQGQQPDQNALKDYSDQYLHSLAMVWLRTNGFVYINRLRTAL